MALDLPRVLLGEEPGKRGCGRTDRATAREDDALGVEYAESVGDVREDVGEQNSSAGAGVSSRG